MAEEVLLTREGLEKIKEEYEELVSVQRREVAARIKEAREFGDISENAEYDAAKNEQAELEDRISKLETMMRQVKIIEESKVKRGMVNVGSKVFVKDMSDGKELELVIVGSMETDPFAGKISNESAVGKGLIGHKIGDIAEIDIPDGKKKYEILKISKLK